MCLDFVNRSYDITEISELTIQKTFAEKWRTLDPSTETEIEVLPSVDEALHHTRKLGGNSLEDQKEIHVFVTGSVHLVGQALGCLEGVDAI